MMPAMAVPHDSKGRPTAVYTSPIARPEPSTLHNASWQEQRIAQCRLIRDLFGDRFRPTIPAPACRTPEVLALARAAYEERALPSGQLDPDRLAVLADALEEAGCDRAELLGHLRGPGPHVRGCWGVDLVLNKEEAT